MTQLINCSITNGIAPDELKIAKVVSVYKSGDVNVFPNYKPISLLPFLFQKFMKKQLQID